MAFEVVETSRRGDAADYAAAAGDRLVIAVGGDGTAHEVVNGLLRRVAARPPRIGFLQRGTGADLRRTIASPRRPEDVAAWLTAISSMSRTPGSAPRWCGGRHAGLWRWGER